MGRIGANDKQIIHGYEDQGALAWNYISLSSGTVIPEVATQDHNEDFISWYTKTTVGGGSYPQVWLGRKSLQRVWIFTVATYPKNMAITQIGTNTMEGFELYENSNGTHTVKETKFTCYAQTSDSFYRSWTTEGTFTISSGNCGDNIEFNERILVLSCDSTDLLEIYDR